MMVVVWQGLIHLSTHPQFTDGVFSCTSARAHGGLEEECPGHGQGT